MSPKYESEAHAMNTSITQATQNDKQISKSIKTTSPLCTLRAEKGENTAFSCPQSLSMLFSTLFEKCR